jgi:hypothetical protein
MTPSDTSGRERRAAARKERRADGDKTESVDSTGTGGAAALAGDALRNAASAAAVGAAVGAARAFSARRRRDADADPAPEQEPQDEDETLDQEPQDEHETLDQEPMPDGEPEPPRDDDEDDDDGRAEPASTDDLKGIVRRARALLGDLHGADAESVSSVARTRTGWTVGLEVVEVRRIPDSTDILATYEVEIDGEGRVLRFERTRRYHRAEADRGGRG